MADEFGLELNDYRCPGCNQLSGLVLGPTQAVCTNDEGSCLIVMFNPSLPDGGLSTAHVVDLPDLPGDVQ